MNQNLDLSPTLFKASNPLTLEEKIFESPKDAYEWMLSHKNCSLKKRIIISWSFPLEETIDRECWVKV